MARISSQGTRAFLQNNPSSGANHTITAATAANPATITIADASGIEIGDWVQVTAPENEVFNDILAQVQAKATNTLTLRGVDATGEDVSDVTGWKVKRVVLRAVCFSGIDRASPPAATVDVTTLCDDARTTVVGMPNPGTLTLNGFYDAEDGGYLLMRQAYEDGVKRWFLILPRDGSALAMRITVTSIAESFGVDAPVSSNATADVSGQPMFYVPEPAA